MRARGTLGPLLVACGMATGAGAMAQLTYPDVYVQNVNWSSGEHLVLVPQPIYAPGDAAMPTSITGTARSEFMSTTRIRLKPGFHAGDLSGDGRFRARINPWMGAPEDLVVIAPGADHVVDDVLHVEKWEKLELGFKLPQEYQDAIDLFFAHYYSYVNPIDPLDPTAPYVATSGNVDHTHDLNPYADDSLRLVMTLTDPSGDQRMKWGFYMKEATWSADPQGEGELIGNAPSPFNVRFRFAPDEEGPWHFGLSIKAPLTLNDLDAQLHDVYNTGYNFVCDPPLPGNNGHLQVNETNRRMLQFRGNEEAGDETPFFGLGVNMADVRNGTWDDNGGPANASYSLHQRDFEDMQLTMEQLHDVGGNFMRMYLMRNIFAPEWVNLGVYDAFKTPQVCDQNVTSTCDNGGWTTNQTGNCQYQCWAFDQMLDHAHANNIYIQLVIDPYPPIVGYERYIWGAHPYLNAYLENTTPPQPLAPNRYDLKRFFYSNVDAENTASERLYNEGVFYYWKRRYKYIMSRWGYSVNLPIIEPFNEVDQMLSYRARNMEHDPSNPNHPADPCKFYGDECVENRLNWVADPGLPPTYNDWLTDIIGFVKDPVDLSDPLHSPLGEDRKMFLTGTGPNDTNTPDAAFYEPCKNPKLELVDVHTSNQNFWDVRANFDEAQARRDAYVNQTTGLKRPFRHGEYSTYAHKTLLIGSDFEERVTYPFFANYEVSFHNELWASSFYGNFTAGTSWCWERVFWWRDGVEMPLYDPANPYQNLTNAIYQPNYMDLNFGFGVEVRNRPIQHHFQTLTDLLNISEVVDLFSGEFSTHRHTSNPNDGNDPNTDEGRKIECYWLLRESEDPDLNRNLAVGWVHNMNAYWDNAWYARSGPIDQELFDCTSPLAQEITLSGLAPNAHYYISFFPTHLNTSECPANAEDIDGNSSVTLNLDDPLSAALSCVQGAFLDTLHSDYAFIISPEPLVKRLQVSSPPDPVAIAVGWDFGVFPNPADDILHLQLPDKKAIEIVLWDLTGRQVGTWHNLSGPLQSLPISQLARGSYWVRVSIDGDTRTKQLIVH